ncbi:MAG: rubrerythrin family protein [Leptolinea sp.]|jgi:VIT1/CCC1 family predicted Fe2+/Mn2+ transporter|nr:rubrerythrin family protein [Leptolinea sp.]
MSSEKIAKYLEFWEEEQNSAYIYRKIAIKYDDSPLAMVYEKMADVEIKHAERWAKEIEKEGGNVPEFKINLRTRILAWLVKQFGPEAVIPSLQAGEKNGADQYGVIADARDMSMDEKSHSRIINTIATGVTKGLGGSDVAQLEGRHKSAGGNALRAAVMGANDGLVSNLSLVMGVAGAALSNQSILITGVAGLLAGACSMALGEWLSVQSSRELYMNQIKIEKEEVESAPEEEAEELSLIYQARGLTVEQAETLSKQIMSNRETAVETLAKEELNIDPAELGGSAWEAAITSFVLFSIGAIVPVLPYIITSGTPAFVLSIGLSGLALFGIGAAITLFTGKTVLYSGLRMVIFGLLAAAITFGIGRLIGVSVAG